MPASFPVTNWEELVKFSGQKYHEIAFTVLNKIIGDEIGKDDLSVICRDAYNFDVPLEKVYRPEIYNAARSGSDCIIQGFCSKNDEQANAVLLLAQTNGILQFLQPHQAIQEVQ